MNKGQNNGIICLIGLSAFLIFLKMHKMAPSDITELALWITGLTAIRYGFIFIKNEIEFLRTKRKLIRNGKKYKKQNEKNQNCIIPEKNEKHSIFLHIEYFLVMILLNVIHYIKTSDKWFFLTILITIYMLFMEVFRYILIFKNKSSKKNIQPKEESNKYHDHIEAMWDEINKN